MLDNVEEWGPIDSWGLAFDPLTQQECMLSIIVSYVCVHYIR